MNLVALRSAALLLALASPALGAQTVDVRDAWVRATVQGQTATGAFMKISTPQALRLVSAASPVASLAEVHEMAMEGDVMKMRAVPSLALPAGKTVELKPGGYHLMMTGLKKPLAANSSVPLTLRFADAKGVEQTVELMLPVRAAAPGSAATPAKASGGHSHGNSHNNSHGSHTH